MKKFIFILPILVIFFGCATAPQPFDYSKAYVKSFNSILYYFETATMSDLPDVKPIKVLANTKEYYAAFLEQPYFAVESELQQPPKTGYKIMLYKITDEQKNIGVIYKFLLATHPFQ